MFGFLERSRRSAHRFCQDNLSAYIDGRLPERDRQRVSRHLEQCQACAWDLRALQRTVGLLHGLPQAKAPRSFLIPRTMPAPSLPIWMRPWAYGAMRVATAAATVVLVIALAGNALAIPALQTYKAVDGSPALGAQAVGAAAATEVNAAPRASLDRAVASPEVGTMGAEPRSPTVRGEQLDATAAPPAAKAEPTKAAGQPLPNGTPVPQGAATGLGGGDSDAEITARMTAAPKGMGGEVTPPTPAATVVPQPAQPTSVAAGRAPEAPAMAPAQVTAPAAPMVGTPSVLAPAGPQTRQDGEDSGARRQGDPYATGVLNVRRQIGDYPWRAWAASAAALAAVLLALTLWIRRLRARWYR